MESNRCSLDLRLVKTKVLVEMFRHLALSGALGGLSGAISKLREKDELIEFLTNCTDQNKLEDALAAATKKVAILQSSPPTQPTPEPIVQPPIVQNKPSETPAPPQPSVQKPLLNDVFTWRNNKHSHRVCDIRNVILNGVSFQILQNDTRRESVKESEKIMSAMLQSFGVKGFELIGELPAKFAMLQKLVASSDPSKTAPGECAAALNLLHRELRKIGWSLTDLKDVIELSEDEILSKRGGDCAVKFNYAGVTNRRQLFFEYLVPALCQKNLVEHTFCCDTSFYIFGSLQTALTTALQIAQIYNHMKIDFARTPAKCFKDFSMGFVTTVVPQAEKDLYYQFWEKLKEKRNDIPGLTDFVAANSELAIPTADTKMCVYDSKVAAEAALFYSRIFTGKKKMHSLRSSNSGSDSYSIGQRAGTKRAGSVDAKAPKHKKLTN